MVDIKQRLNSQLARRPVRLMLSAQVKVTVIQSWLPYNLCKILLKLLAQKPSKIIVTCTFSCLDTFWIIYNLVIQYTCGFFRYYFPTYENDTLLCTLSDSESDLTAQEHNGNVTVIGEDTSKLRALKQSSILNQVRLHRCPEN